MENGGRARSARPAFMTRLDVFVHFPFSFFGEAEHVQNKIIMYELEITYHRKNYYKKVNKKQGEAKYKR